MHCGIWVDHRRAVLVKLEDGRATTEKVLSGVGARARRTGGSKGATAKGAGRSRGGGRIAGPQSAMPEDRVDRKFDQALRHYYERVAEAIGDAKAIFLMGPGEAAAELAKTLDGHPELGPRVCGIEAADKLTDRQVVARVREVFSERLPRLHGGAGAPVQD
jgi:hypothetical protein